MASRVILSSTELVSMRARRKKHRTATRPSQLEEDSSCSFRCTGLAGGSATEQPKGRAHNTRLVECNSYSTRLLVYQNTRSGLPTALSTVQCGSAHVPLADSTHGPDGRQTRGGRRLHSCIHTPRGAGEEGRGKPVMCPHPSYGPDLDLRGGRNLSTKFWELFDTLQFHCLSTFRRIVERCQWVCVASAGLDFPRIVATCEYLNCGYL
jgi:hypothetical protein